MLFWLEFTQLPCIVCPEHKSIADRKALPCLAYEQTPFFANVYVCLILSKQFPALNFLFTTVIPIQKKNKQTSLRLANYVPSELLINSWCNLKANKEFFFYATSGPLRKKKRGGCSLNWSLFLYHGFGSISYAEREISSWNQLVHMERLHSAAPQPLGKHRVTSSTTQTLALSIGSVPTSSCWQNHTLVDVTTAWFTKSSKHMSPID